MSFTAGILWLRGWLQPVGVALSWQTRETGLGRLGGGEGGGEAFPRPRLLGEPFWCFGTSTPLSAPRASPSLALRLLSHVRTSFFKSLQWNREGTCFFVCVSLEFRREKVEGTICFCFSLQRWRHRSPAAALRLTREIQRGAVSVSSSQTWWGMCSRQTPHPHPPCSSLPPPVGS